MTDVAMVDVLMAAGYLLSAKWLLASAGCVVAGLLAWLLLNGAARVWPALRTRRAVWLAAQGVVAATALLPFLPNSPRLAPQIDLSPAPALSAEPASAAPTAPASPAQSADHAAHAAPAQYATRPTPAQPAAHGDPAYPAAHAASAQPAAPASPTQSSEHTGHAAPPYSAARPNPAQPAAHADPAKSAARPSQALSAAPAGPAAASAHADDAGAPDIGGDAVGRATASLAQVIIARALPMMAGLWLLAYAAGLAWSIVRLLRARQLWRGLLAAAHRLSPAALQANRAFTTEQRRQITQHGLIVMRTEAGVSPMLIGVFRPILLLPAHLDTLSTEQQQMIITHELHHWRVRDPLCLAIAAILQTIFWFNPPLRWMAKQMEWALELQCDQHVLAGRPQHQRKQYAVSLLQQWAAPIGVAAFNGATIAARIRHMQTASLPALSTAAAWTTAAALTVILAAGVILQPALAFSLTALTEPASTAAGTPAAAIRAAAPPPIAAASAGAWRAPLDEVRVTSFFGVKRSLPRTPHKGIDFGASKGTPVHATADGTIIAAGAIAENNGKYGTTVIIDHGDQRSLYAHLDSVNVKPGQRVQAGQLIGAVGETGLATGPHLHLEVRQNGQIIDPATMLANLDAYATPRALKVRRQQLPSKG
jgi:murein DD-endopeptidase MepM/ murein hydrolase activator NlpD